MEENKQIEITNNGNITDESKKINKRLDSLEKYIKKISNSLKNIQKKMSKKKSKKSKKRIDKSWKAGKYYYD